MNNLTLDIYVLHRDQRKRARCVCRDKFGLLKKTWPTFRAFETHAGYPKWSPTWNYNIQILLNKPSSLIGIFCLTNPISRCLVCLDISTDEFTDFDEWRHNINRCVSLYCGRHNHKNLYSLLRKKAYCQCPIDWVCFC